MDKEGAEVTSAGRSFQTRAPATEKARRPTVASLTAGTHRSSEVEDRSLCRVGMLATGVNCRRYWKYTASCTLQQLKRLSHRRLQQQLCWLASAARAVHLVWLFISCGVRYIWHFSNQQHTHRTYRLPSNPQDGNSPVPVIFPNFSSYFWRRH